MRIGLDLDGTTADYMRQLHIRGQELGTIAQGRFSTPTTYDMIEEGWFDSKEDFFATHQFLCESGDMKNLVPLEEDVNGAVELLQKLGHTVVVTTARIMPNHSDELNKAVAEDTRLWVERHLPSVDGLIVTDNESKLDADMDVYIDDSPSQHMLLTSAGKKVVMRHQNYNMHISGKRVSSLRELARVLR